MYNSIEPITDAYGIDALIKIEKGMEEIEQNFNAPAQRAKQYFQELTTWAASQKQKLANNNTIGMRM